MDKIEDLKKVKGIEKLEIKDQENIKGGAKTYWSVDCGNGNGFGMITDGDDIDWAYVEDRCGFNAEISITEVP